MSLKKLSILATPFSLFLALASLQSSADGLSDLRNALTQLNGISPISAQLESSYTEHRGKKKKRKTTTGFAQVNLTDSELGLQVMYSNQTLLTSEVEANEKEQNEDVDTPTLNAIDDIEATELRNMLSAAPNLLRTLNKAKWLNEEVVEFQGVDMRKINFELPLEAIINNKEVREYVDKFSNQYSIIINEVGVPQQSQLTFKGKGSAFIFFSLSASQTNTSTYQVINNRLVNMRRDFTRSQKSTWGLTDASGAKILTILTPEKTQTSKEGMTSYTIDNVTSKAKIAQH